MINAQECSSVKNNNTGLPYTIFDILSQNVFDSVGDPDPYVFGPPGKNSKKNLNFYCFVTSL